MRHILNLLYLIGFFVIRYITRQEVFKIFLIFYRTRLVDNRRQNTEVRSSEARKQGSAEVFPIAFCLLPTAFTRL